MARCPLTEKAQACQPPEPRHHPSAAAECPPSRPQPPQRQAGAHRRWRPPSPGEQRKRKHRRHIPPSLQRTIYMSSGARDRMPLRGLSRAQRDSHRLCVATKKTRDRMNSQPAQKQKQKANRETMASTAAGLQARMRARAPRGRRSSAQTRSVRSARKGQGIQSDPGANHDNMFDRGGSAMLSPIHP